MDKYANSRMREEGLATQSRHDLRLCRRSVDRPGAETVERRELGAECNVKPGHLLPHRRVLLAVLSQFPDSAEPGTRPLFVHTI
jgi:hypothetical protein